MKNYPYYEVDHYPHMLSFLKGIKGKYADRTALTYYGRKGEAYHKSYKEVADTAAAFGQFLLENGFSGKNIAIVGENSFEWIAAFMGAAAGGSVAVLMDPEQSPGIMAESAGDTECALMLISDQVLASFSPQEQAAFPSIIVMGQSAEYKTFAECLPASKEAEDFWKKSIDPASAAVIVFTSGTTSKAKPLLLSHKGLLLNASEAVSMVHSSEYTFSALPMYHTYGLTCGLLCHLVSGMSVGFSTDIKTMLRDIMLFNPAIIMAVPLLTDMLHKSLKEGAEKALGADKYNELAKAGLFRRAAPHLVAVKEAVLKRLGVIISGGAYLSPSVQKELFAFGILVLEGYGISECSPLVSVNREKDYKFGSVGKALPSYQVKLDKGEIAVKGESLMTGYYKNEEANKEALRDGWFYTGDLGRMDRKGRLYITGRKKNLIVLKNGKKISPEEIEALLADVPMVGEIKAYASASGETADDVKLAVMIYPNPEESAGLSSYEILENLQQSVAEVNARLPHYKQIQMVNLSANEFAKTATRKIKR